MIGSEEKDECTVTILHFNDCYNIEPQDSEPVGGAARFRTVLKSFEASEPLVLFSGDIVSPSNSEFRSGSYAPLDPNLYFRSTID